VDIHRPSFEPEHTSQARRQFRAFLSGVYTLRPNSPALARNGVLKTLAAALDVERLDEYGKKPFRPSVQYVAD